MTTLNTVIVALISSCAGLALCVAILAYFLYRLSDVVEDLKYQCSTLRRDCRNYQMRIASLEMHHEPRPTTAKDW